MSLISLSSKSISRNDTTQQAPFNFKNFFPQPIIIKPQSQVCLTTFYHFRTEGLYNINANNDLIGFCFGDRQFNNVMYASLTHGNYEGDDLATEVARAMNAANVQQNYEWTCTFTIGNPSGNPVTNDKFTMTYSNVTTPDAQGGTWSLLSSRSQNGTLQNNDTVGNFSEMTNDGDGPIPIVLKNGLLVHEGYVRFENIGATHEHASLDDPIALSLINMGLISSSMAVDSSDMSRATTFNSQYGEILVETVADEIQISTLGQRQGTKNINLPNNRGKDQVYRRIFNKAFLTAILENSTDRIAIEIHRISSNYSWVVKIQVSTDGGTTYSDLADGKGTNADGRPNIYSESIGGVPFTSLLYSTIGVPDGSGGRAINPVNGKPTATANSASNRKAPFIPFMEILERAEHTTGLDLTNETFSLNIGTQGTPTLVDDNQFTMSWQRDTSGRGYDYGMFEDTAAVTPSAQINSTLLTDFVIGNPTIDEGTFKYDVFADNSVPINSGVKIADLIYDMDETANGQWEMSGIDGAAGISLDPILFNQDAKKPDIETDDAIFKLEGIFNPANNPVTLSNGEFVSESSITGRQHDEPEDETIFTGLLTDTLLGADLPQSSFIVLARANQQTLGNFPNAPVRANGMVTPKKLEPLQRFGTSFKVLGFNEPIIVNDDATFDFESDTKPYIQMDETSLHISIPELTGVISFEGEAENTAKTIKIIPKNEFTESSTSDVMTFTAPYEEWIDINNAEPLVLNEMTMQVRKPDGTMATNLKPITRASIKIQENPEVKKLEAQRQLIDAMASTKAQSQNTGRINFVDASSWVAS